MPFIILQKSKQNHKYLKKYKGKNGKWVYVYKLGVGKHNKNKQNSVKNLKYYNALTKTQKKALKNFDDMCSTLTEQDIIDTYKLKNVKPGELTAIAKWIVDKIGTDEFPVYIHRRFLPIYSTNNSTTVSSSFVSFLEDKRFKNQFELGEDATSSGLLSPTKSKNNNDYDRDSWEKLLYNKAFQEEDEYKNLKKGSYLPKKLGRERPIYGVVSGLGRTIRDISSIYGHFMFRIKKDVVDQCASFTCGNSSSIQEYNIVNGHKNIFSKQHPLGVLTTFLGYPKFFKKTNYDKIKIAYDKNKLSDIYKNKSMLFKHQYTEVQLMGDMSVDKFDYVTYSSFIIHRNSKNPVDIPEMRKRMLIDINNKTNLNVNIKPPISRFPR